MKTQWEERLLVGWDKVTDRFRLSSTLRHDIATVLERCTCAFIARSRRRSPPLATTQRPCRYAAIGVMT